MTDYHNPKIKIFESVEDLAGEVCRDLIKAVEDKGPKLFHLALSGGRTPAAVYSRLYAETSTNPDIWSRIHVYWGDERCVAPDDPESNFGMANSELLRKVGIPEGNIHRIRGEEEPKREANRYEDEVKSIVPMVDGFPRFDWIFLGLGADGHTASLFPGSRALDEQKRLFVSIIGPKPPARRITMTFPLIINANKVAFLITGEDKAEILGHILGKSGGYQNFPSSKAIFRGRETSLYIDKVAAMLISRDIPK